MTNSQARKLSRKELTEALESKLPPENGLLAKARLLNAVDMILDGSVPFTHVVDAINMGWLPSDSTLDEFFHSQTKQRRKSESVKRQAQYISISVGRKKTGSYWAAISEDMTEVLEIAKKPEFTDDFPSAKQRKQAREGFRQSCEKIIKSLETKGIVVFGHIENESFNFKKTDFIKKKKELEQDLN